MILQLTGQNKKMNTRKNEGWSIKRFTGRRYMHTHTGSRFGLLAMALISAGTASQAWADDPDSALTLDTITVTAAKIRALEQFTPTGSRLGLSAQELPATLDVIDNDEMIGSGFLNLQQAADRQEGR